MLLECVKCIWERGWLHLCRLRQVLKVLKLLKVLKVLKVWLQVAGVHCFKCNWREMLCWFNVKCIWRERLGWGLVLSAFGREVMLVQCVKCIWERLCWFNVLSAFGREFVLVQCVKCIWERGYAGSMC
jgi:hypothetical protein